MTMKINPVAPYTPAAADNQANQIALNSDIAKYTKDFIEISDRTYNGKKPAFNYDSLFAQVDSEIEQAKQASKEHADRQLKKKIDDEITKRRQRPRVEARKILMKETGVLWTGGLTPESQQILMQKAPGILAEYTAKQKEEQEEIYDEEV